MIFDIFYGLNIWRGWKVFCDVPRIINDILYFPRINYEIYFVWQAQYLGKLKCTFSWPVLYFVTFSEIGGARNLVFFNRNALPRWNKSGFRSGRFEMTILYSDRRNVLASFLYWQN